MTGRHRRTLDAVFADPVRANIPWSDVQALFVAAGATISEGRGSRMRVSLTGVDAVLHRPHPRHETDRGAVRSVRRFLREAGITPMTTMTHDGYVAKVELDEDAGLFHGEVLNTRAVLTFQGRT